MTKRYSYNKNSNKRIWIDLNNTADVPFFAPIIKNLKEKGFTVVVSARNYSQTVSLAELYNFDFTTIGKYYGKNKFFKIIGLVYRSFQLFPFVIKSQPSIAISHGSRSQMIVAFLFRIPVALFLDYEFIQTIPFMKPIIIFIPNIISNQKVKMFASKVISYPGIKENIYVPKFKPDRSILRQLKIDETKIIVFLRPPDYEARYHRLESEKLFTEILEILTQNDSTKTIILPRDIKQKHQILSDYQTHIKNNRLCIPNEVVDGLNLMWHSDIVISGSNTMSREAAALGLPVYSIFMGEISDVDRYLVESQRLILIKNISDVRKKMKLKKKQKLINLENINSLALQFISNEIENFVSEVAQNKLPIIKENSNEFAKN